MSQNEAVENNRNSRTIDTRTIDKREQQKEAMYELSHTWLDNRTMSVVWHTKKEYEKGKKDIT